MAEEEGVSYVKGQLDRLDKMEEAIGWAREELLDHHEEIVAGKCEDCGKVLFAGDMGHRCLDGDPLFCAEHAYTWADVKESYEEEGGLKDTDPEAHARFIKSLEQHLATGGSLEDKILHEL